MKTFDHGSGEHLEVDGARIYFEVIGGEELPPLVVLHGGFGTLEDFNSFLPEVGSGFRVIGIDSRGHGKSTLGSTALTYELMQRDVQAVLEHLGIGATSLIGFSDGGIIGYRLAALTSLKVEKLVTIGSHWQLRNDDPTREILSKVTGESWKKKFPETYEVYQKHNPSPDFDAFARELVKMWLDSGPSGYPGEAIRNIACPLLVVRGDEDHLFSRKDACELCELVRGSRLLSIPFAGHVAHEDQKEIFVISLKQFLAL
jgi:pimeloyl-ACP methyl ester carboxylesterase